MQIFLKKQPQRSGSFRETKTWLDFNQFNYGFTRTIHAWKPASQRCDPTTYTIARLAKRVLVRICLSTPWWLKSLLKTNKLHLSPFTFYQRYVTKLVNLFNLIQKDYEKHWMTLKLVSPQMSFLHLSSARLFSTHGGFFCGHLKNAFTITSGWKQHPKVY